MVAIFHHDHRVDGTCYTAQEANNMAMVAERLHKIQLLQEFAPRLVVSVVGKSFDGYFEAI